MNKIEKHIGDTWMIVIHPFGYPMYASAFGCGWSDAIADAYVYDSRDNPTMKIAFFSALAHTTFGPSVHATLETIQ